MLRTRAPGWIVCSILTITITGCGRNSGEAVVLAKEHIDAALPTETRIALSEPGAHPQLRATVDDEIAVNGYVMQPE